MPESGDPRPSGARRLSIRWTASKYVASEYVKIILLTTSGLLVLYSIVELFEIGRLLYRYGAALSYMPRLLLLKLPVITYQMVPIGALVGTLIATGMMIKNNELIMLRICGFTYSRLFGIISVPCVSIAALSFELGEELVPRATEIRNRIIVQEIRQVERAAVRTLRGVWIPGVSSIFHARAVRPEDKSLLDARVYQLDEHFQIRVYLEAAEARYVRPNWVFFRGALQEFEGGDLKTYRPFDEHTVFLPESFDDFEILKEDPDSMSVPHLFRLVQKLNREGYDANEYEVALHSRLSFPFLTLPFSLLGFALAHMGGGRKKTLGGSLFLAVLSSFFAWTLYGLTLILGRHGLLPPEVAAWLIHPPLFFAGLVILTREM